MPWPNRTGPTLRAGYHIRARVSRSRAARARAGQSQPGLGCLRLGQPPHNTHHRTGQLSGEGARRHMEVEVANVAAADRKEGDQPLGIGECRISTSKEAAEANPAYDLLHVDRRLPDREP